MRIQSPALLISVRLSMLLIFLSVLTFSTNITYATNDNHGEGLIDGHKKEDIKRGKRFFMGLLPFERQHNSCVSCHNLKPTDSLNWNPSALDIAEKYHEKDFAAFQSAVMQPIGKKLEASHVNFVIPEEDLKLVKIYLDDLAMTGLPTEKPSINNIIVFIFLGLLITWALLELIFFRKIKYKFIPTLAFLLAFGYQVKMLVEEGIRLGRTPDYAPDQPIKFSHKVHAGDNKIDCLYCHHTAEHSKSAGIPEMNLCMNCHVLVREGTYSGKFEIAKVVNAVENKTPVKWLRIHNLPDHVFFSHAIHVGSAKLDCNKCHGPVEEMDIMKQHSDLSMGWCINCHRETQVDFAENPYFETYEQMHKDFKSGKRPMPTADEMGANDCMRCHY